MTAPVSIARDLDRIDGREFDVVVVGAGIYGALIALYAAQRGLSALLVDRADFGGGASFKSLRTIHGGLRYLQTLDFARARASSRQRDWWLLNFPDLVVSRPCLMPLYGGGLRGPTAVRAAALLAKLLRLDSPGLPAERRLRPLQLLEAAEVRRRVPGIPDEGLRAGALWSDAFMPDSSRVVIECVRWAVAAGAQAANYVEVTGARAEGPGRSTLALLDQASGNVLTVHARACVNAAGAGVDRVAERLRGRRRSLLQPTTAWNLLLDARLPGDCSLALTPPRPGARTYFVHPFHGRVLAGTGHAAAATAGEFPGDDLLATMRSDLDAAFPAARLGRAKVLRVLADVLPGVRRNDPGLALRPRVLRDTAGRGAALLHVIGVKFTEAPDVAGHVVDLLGSKSRAQLPPRPRPVAGQGWNVLADPVEQTALLELAASESALYVEDLVERRTNAWCDPEAERRVRNLTAPHFKAAATGPERQEYSATERTNHR